MPVVPELLGAVAVGLVVDEAPFAEVPLLEVPLVAVALVELREVPVQSGTSPLVAASAVPRKPIIITSHG
jgi:hypothetical protein